MKAIIDAPGLIVPPNGILSVGAKTLTDKMADGVTFTPYGCDVLFAHDPTCWGTRGDKALQQCSEPAEFSPFILESTLTWHTVDMGAGPREMLEAEFKVGAGATIERLIELGIVDVGDGVTITKPTLSGTISTTGISGRGLAIDSPKLTDGLEVTGDTHSARDAVGLVESKMLDAADHTGGSGTLYMNPLVAVMARDALVRDGDDLVTFATGSRVIIGNFAGSAVYGHVGDVDLYLGKVEVVDMVEHAANEYIVQAEQYALATWNTCAVFKQAVTAPTGVEP